MARTFNPEKQSHLINEEISASLKFRRQRIEMEKNGFDKLRMTDVSNFLEWYLEKSKDERLRTVSITTDSETSAWTIGVTSDGAIAGITRRSSPHYYDGLITTIVDNNKPSYDVLSLYAEHIPLQVRDVNGNENTIYSAGISVAVINNKGELLVAPKTSALTGVRADSLASSFANIVNLGNAMNGPEGLAKLGGQTMSLVETLSGKKPETILEVLNGVDIVDNLPAGDENKQYMNVLSAIKKVRPEVEEVVAQNVKGIWVTPMTIRMTCNLGFATEHLIKAANLAEKAFYYQNFVPGKRLTVIG